MTIPYRIVATDLDGTIVRTDGTISDRTRDALRLAQDSGAAVIFVTGRPPRWMHPISEATGHTGLAVCANGAILYDLGEERIISELALQPEDLASVVERLAEVLPGVAFAVERSGVLSHEPDYVPAWDDDQITVLPRAELLVLPATKLLVRSSGADPDAFLASAQEALGDRVSMTRSSVDELLEISAAGVTKAFGLERFARTHGMGPADVIAFGDMPNDLPMLAWAGHPVAVANAHPEVLAIAAEVTASNDDDGVAQVLERLFA
ncbi:Cof-type HAD-IIB family hydrolase [Acidothermaceae bacterium B102]|nr:Cof-type HAD-IIB family hydrolase [Acidothermaceae bacterium B102]